MTTSMRATTQSNSLAQNARPPIITINSTVKTIQTIASKKFNQPADDVNMYLSPYDNYITGWPSLLSPS